MKLNLPTDDRDSFECVVTTGVFFNEKDSDRLKIIDTIAQVSNYCFDYGYKLDIRPAIDGETPSFKCLETGEPLGPINNQCGHYFIARFHKP